LPLSLVVILLDQVTKLVVARHIGYGTYVTVLPVLDFTLRYNPGAAWSMLADAAGWQRWLFSVLALAVSVVILIWLRRLDGHSRRLLAAAVALILAGAVGNLIDRLWLGQVVDFIVAHWGEHQFPAFNVADSAITIGAGLMLFDALTDKSGQ
jgi:signal peptidase II